MVSVGAAEGSFCSVFWRAWGFLLVEVEGKTTKHWILRVVVGRVCCSLLIDALFVCRVVAGPSWSY